MTLFSNIYPPKTTPDSPEKLLIFHGFLGMSDNWKTLASQYAELGFQVHALDLRNHGKSFHSPDFSCELMVSDVLDYCQQQNILQTHVLGHSMGGKLAMFLATQNPGLVQKLIVADIAPRHYEPHHDNILTALQTVDFSTKPSRAAVEAELSKHIPDAGTRQFLLKNLYWESPGQLAFRFNLAAFLENKSAVGEALPANRIFQKETLFICGGNSDYITSKDFDNIKTHFPNSSISTIPNVGHWLHAENPTLFFHITSEFLSKP